jgi:hypothetical protein
MTSEHNHDSPSRGPAGCDTAGRHGMLLFGEDPVYLSHLPRYACPRNFQVLLEVGPDRPALDTLRADRARYGDGLYTVDPVPFPIADLAPHDGAPARTSLEVMTLEPAGHIWPGQPSSAHSEA